MTDVKLRMFGVACALIFVVLFLIAFVLVQWIPPMSPSLGAEAVADIFRENSVKLRILAILMMFAAAVYIPWTVVISDLMREMEGRSYFLPTVQLGSGIMAQISFLIPSYLWAAAAFRPDRDPQVTYMIVDLAWLFFITCISPFLLQYLAFAMAIFRDKSVSPLFPRWLGYFQIWVCLSFLPGLLAYFFKTGPFAWNGIFVWWIPLLLFSAWFFVMAWMCRKAVLKSASLTG